MNRDLISELTKFHNHTRQTCEPNWVCHGMLSLKTSANPVIPLGIVSKQQ